MCGQVRAGAIFPPVGNDPGKNPWAWRFWLAGTDAQSARDGRAASELAAKNRLMAELQDWLRRAGLEVAHADA